MPILYQFYQISEAKPSAVSACWKVSHIILCIVTAVSGFLAAFMFGLILERFDYNCILYPELSFDESLLLNGSISDLRYSVRALDLTHTIWSPASSCNFSQFTPLFTGLAALIFALFFSILPRGGSGNRTDVMPQSWLIIYPAICFTLVSSLIFLVSTINLYSGVKELCTAIDKEFKWKLFQCYPSISVYGDQLQHECYYPKIDPYSSLTMAISLSVIGVGSWIAQLLVLLLRLCCGVDFKLELVVIGTKDSDSDEEITVLHEEDNDEHDDDTDEDTEV